jgi:hypothetical protein
MPTDNYTEPDPHTETSPNRDCATRTGPEACAQLVAIAETLVVDRVDLHRPLL